MPELPEVEAVCRRLREEAQGATIRRLVIRRASICKPGNAEDIEAAARNRKLRSIERRGKHILLGLNSGTTLYVHLRMTGNLYVIPDYRFAPLSARALFELRDNRAIVFDDPRALGKITLSSKLEQLGVEPLTPAFSAEKLKEMLSQSRQPAKTFLMDQRHIAGLGNIYAAEALFKAGQDPRKSIATKRAGAMYSSIVAVLADAVHSAYSTYSKPGHLLAAEEQKLMVYGREGEPCRVCGRAIRRIPQGGRSTYFCAGCQK
ncbi:MAG: bifunctional DNA-formamidopyrimidine glycosylase/DNA-(apurinic or apyrimidinic site) lyase [Acidobacteria bacterium]|nr:bifunctional DNA-formamidopyrimidine glycosylase/DNA-(apurinic or apyrimidinic site) lyase [Acidobacteriota bacterium]